jgi:predicted DNA-binding protein (MmcQ/YjbR family)
VPSVIARVRKICLALPDTTEVRAWAAPTFRVHGRVFGMYADGKDNQSGGRTSIWLNCDPVSQGFMIADQPKRYFKPKYVGPYGWVGVYLDGRVNWKTVADLIRDAYDLTAAKVKSKRGKK